jgi:acetoin utilization deacetylase AcuC-like enzyme
MEVAYVSHPAFERHDTGPWHPERPARLRAVEHGVMSSGLSVGRIEADEVTEDDLHRVHDSDYVKAVRNFCLAGGGHLDADTVAGPDSFSAALLAAGAGWTAVEALRADGGATALAAVRPPGHHALRSQAMGFCLFNNVAVTAARLRVEGNRVAIVDWDVHHGNGTQDLFAVDPDILYVSIHQHPFYPGLGAAEEMGEGLGLGSVINLPVPAGTAGDLYEAAWDRLVIPVLQQFKPDWLLVSCGYDAHADDPLAELRLESQDYRRLASGLLRVIKRNRIVAFLEGGYHLPAITESVAATLQGLNGADADAEHRFRSPREAFEALDRTCRLAGRFWRID